MANARQTRFSLDISKFVQKTGLNIDTVIRKVILDLGTQIVYKTPVDTGRARANWMYSFGTINTTTTEETTLQPSLFSNISTGTNKADQSYFITNSLPYIVRLEYGWSKQAPSGMVRVTLANFVNIFNNAIASVK